MSIFIHLIPSHISMSSLQDAEATVRYKRGKSYSIF
uniref:Uncharacterized protein n=1 Tax=Ciona intestinalis TaxID=7719 RepID=H2XNZ3_CIOIN